MVLGSQGSSGAAGRLGTAAGGSGWLAGGARRLQLARQMRCARWQQLTGGGWALSGRLAAAQPSQPAGSTQALASCTAAESLAAVGQASAYMEEQAAAAAVCGVATCHSQLVRQTYIDSIHCTCINAGTPLTPKLPLPPLFCPATAAVPLPGPPHRL